MNNLGKSIVIASAIFSASYFLTNLHTTRTASEGMVYVVNNVTGAVKACGTGGGGGCGALKMQDE